MGYIGNAPYQGVLTGGNIQDGTVETTDLADAAVTTAKLHDQAVTEGKLHTTLDLSGKTLTLPAAAVTAHAPVSSVAGKTGVVTLSNSDVGLGNVENKSSSTIRGELSSANVTTALGYTPVNKAGDTMTGSMFVTPGSRGLSDFPENTIGFVDPNHTAGWGVSQGIAARTGDAIWALGSNGNTGKNDTVFLGVGSVANNSFSTVMSFDQDRTTVTFPQRVRAGRTTFNWHNYGGNPPGAYWHIKTNLWAGDDPTGDSQPTMSFFHILGYNYDGQSIDSKVGFHNWRGNFYSVVLTNNGSRSAAVAPYKSSDGFTVLVFNIGTSYPGVRVDYSQWYPYAFLNVQVTAQSFSGSTTGQF